MSTKALREKRATIVAAARAHIDKDTVTAEDRAAFDAAMAEADTLKADIDRLERHEKIERELAASREVIAQVNPLAGSPDQQANTAENEKRLMRAWMIGGMNGLSAEDRAVVAQRIAPIQGAASTGTPTSGGYTIAPLFQAELLIAMKAMGGMRAVASSITTATGADLPWPTMDDTANAASIIAESTQLPPDTDLTFGSVSMKGFTYRAGPMLISLQLLQDSAFDFDALIRDAMAARYVRGQNPHFTTGSGVGQPQGIVTASQVGKVGAAGQVNSLIYDDLVDLEHSVDPAYRPGSRYMFHDTTLAVLKKLKDSQGRPLWAPGIAVDAPDTINGYSYVINQDMAQMGANAKSVAFGNFSTYKVRDILGMQLMRLTERYADYLQVGYISFMRTDGRLISAAQPVKLYQNPAA